MALIFCVTAAAIALSADSSAGIAAWIVLMIVGLAGLYEESWTFGGAEASVTQRSGLIVLAKKTSIPFSTIEAIRLVPHVRGTIPGTEDEKLENEAALRGERADDGERKRSAHKKPFVSLVLETSDGTRYLIDTMPARRIDALRISGLAIAGYCAKELSQG